MRVGSPSTRAGCCPERPHLLTLALRSKTSLGKYGGRLRVHASLGGFGAASSARGVRPPTGGLSRFQTDASHSPQECFRVLVPRVRRGPARSSVRSPFFA